MIKTVNIFSEKNSIILLNRSSCLLWCQLRIQCHNAELKANDVEVCFISMCMAGRFVEWKMIYPHRTKKAVTFGPFPKKVQVCKSFTWNTFNRENDPSCMIIRLCGLSLYPVMDSVFSLENTPSLVFQTQVHKEMLDPAFCAKWITTTAFM